jgi:dynein heavy chain, axonemal
MQDGFIDRLQKYEKDDINEKNLTKARVYLKRVDFDLTQIGKASQACKSLGMWCIAIDNYAKVAKKVNPLKLRVSEMTSKLDEKNRELNLKQKELQKVQDKV